MPGSTRSTSTVLWWSATTGAARSAWTGRPATLGRVRGAALVETFLRPLPWAEFPAQAAELFQTLRSPGAGETMALDDNFFIEAALPNSVLSGLAEDDLAVYRSPYPDPASRRPLLQWPREIPLDDEPADVRDRIAASGRWLADTPAVPKLLLTTEPGQLVSPAIVDWAVDNVVHLEVEGVGRAGHHAPEDQPDAIGRAIAGWLRRHGLNEPDSTEAAARS